MARLLVWHFQNRSVTPNEQWRAADKAEFDIENIRLRVVAGNFDGIGTDEIVAFSSAGEDDGETILHVWNFDHQSSKFVRREGWRGQYQASRISGKVVRGNFDADAEDEIAALYSTGNGKNQIHIWDYDSESQRFNHHTAMISNDTEPHRLSHNFSGNYLPGVLTSGKFASETLVDTLAAFALTEENKATIQMWIPLASRSDEFHFRFANSGWQWQDTPEGEP